MLRHRGIDVGEVSRVEGDDALDGVTLGIRLDLQAAGLACEDSRFWIERPKRSPLA